MQFFLDTANLDGIRRGVSGGAGNGKPAAPGAG